MKNAIVMLAAMCIVGVSALRGEEKITVKGSDTMVILAQRWAEKYMANHKDINIQVTGGGSGVGIAALINGSTDICNASRSMKQPEREKLKQRYGTSGVEIKCAMDGLALYVNEANPINELTMQQIKDLYTGKVTNWNQVGGKNEKVILYSRENSSGTYVYFKENVLMNEDFAPSAQNMPGTAAVVNAVARDKSGIGYGGSAYAKGIKELKVKADEKATAYSPSLVNIKSGNYPISRFLFMYVKNKPTGAMKEYIDWTLSDAGQKIVTEIGYFPIR